MRVIDARNFVWTVPSIPTPDYQKNTYAPGSSAAGITSIDIHSTVITDSTTKESTKLDSFFKQVKDEKLQMDTDAVVSDGEHDAAFDFEYDDSGEKFGAGTAFLQD